MSQQNQNHPYGLENGWTWMANFLNLDPVPDICPTLLVEFIEIAGFEMWTTYKQQFQKLLLVVQQQYIPKLDKVCKETIGSRSDIDLLT